jgi:DNA helicase-2/ATP-dependent DNA helicase PcrA
MTLHSAKGLEFDYVFLPGWEEGVFPHQRALDESGGAGLEEERRLAYVGLTRARLRAFVSYAANRRIHNLWQSLIPSRFVDELPKAAVERFVDAGLYGSGGGATEWPRGLSEPRRPMRGFGRGAEPRLVAAGPAGGGRSYGVGERVFHLKFGYGSVTAAEGDKLEIAFDKAGSKRVMASFVMPAERAG